jgi:N-acetylneuraminate synthase/sialic acid synthase
MNFSLDLNKEVYVIAEIGHNHQGVIETAFELFRQAKLSGANAVKLQKRNNKKLYTKKFYNQIYQNKNSFGETYGLHREFLEFDEIQYKELQSFAKEIQIDFFATPFDFASLEFLEKLNMPAYKIASGDLMNTPLQKEISKLKKPIFLSTGGGTLLDIKRAYENITSINRNLSILHCTAAYPAPIEDMNLDVIKKLKEEFRNCRIGLSDHENGIDAAPIAYMLGASIFEKHFTLDRAKKGTDHSFSLEPMGLTRFVRNLHRIKKMIGSNEKKLLNSEVAPLFKMKKSIVAKKSMQAGKILEYSDLDFKSPGEGVDPYLYTELLGKKLKRNINEEDFILLSDVQ